MLQLGATKPWPDAIEGLTGQRKMDGVPILEFFKPLYDWLVAENKKTNAPIGWDEDKYGEHKAILNSIFNWFEIIRNTFIANFFFSSSECWAASKEEKKEDRKQ